MENQNCEIVETTSQQKSKKGVFATIVVVAAGAVAGFGIVKYLKNRKAKKNEAEIEVSEDSTESVED